MKLKSKDIWLKEPVLHDYPAAEDYLSLLVNPDVAERISKELEFASVITKKAKDVLRASELPLLSSDNIHVKENIKKVKQGKKLSPILLVRLHNKLVIADGYHRLCSIYYLSEDLEIPCKIV